MNPITIIAISILGLLALLPSSVIFGAKPFTLDKPTEKVTITHTAVLIGESLSSHYKVSENETWVKKLQEQIGLALPHWQLVNASMPSYGPRQVRRQLESILNQYKPDLLILQLGNNDALRASAIRDIRADYTRLIKKAQTFHVPIVIIGSSLAKETGENYAARFLALHQELALAHKTALIPDLLQDVISDPSKLSNDGIHANIDGHKLIAKNHWPKLKAILQCTESNTTESKTTESKAPKDKGTQPSCAFSLEASEEK